MPCDTLNTVGLEMKNMDPDILVAALKEAGYTVGRNGNAVTFSKGNIYGKWEAGSLNVSTSSLRGPTAEGVAKDIRQAYSREVVRVAARRFGATVTSDAKDKNKMRLRLKGGR
jgi:hypothetical protein